MRLDSAWEKIERELKFRTRVLSGSPYILNAKQIKDITGREPRLMANLNERKSSPSVLGGIAILPVSNGSYALLPGDPYHSFQREAPEVEWNLSEGRHLMSLPWESGPRTEAQAIDMALHSGILSHFVQEKELTLTRRNRLRSSEFSFVFGENPRILTSVKGVQTEMDGGFEGEHGCYALEAKMGFPENFHIRQLYFPYRVWDQELEGRKSVHSVFLFAEGKKICLRLYGFQNKEHFHSIKLLRARNYVLSEPESAPVSFSYPGQQRSGAQRLLADVLSEVQTANLPALPFPQANDLRRVLSVVDLARHGEVKLEDLGRACNLVPRQTSYYTRAAEFLRLVERRGSRYRLTTQGRSFTQGSRAERDSLLLKEVARLPVFRDTLEHWLRKGVWPDPSLVAGWIQRETKLAKSTVPRRAGTVLAWMQALEEGPLAPDSARL